MTQQYQQVSEAENDVLVLDEEADMSVQLPEEQAREEAEVPGEPVEQPRDSSRGG